MAKETKTEEAIPESYRWDKLTSHSGIELKKFYAFFKLGAMKGNCKLGKQMGYCFPLLLLVGDISHAIHWLLYIVFLFLHQLGRGGGVSCPFMIFSGLKLHLFAVCRFMGA